MIKNLYVAGPMSGYPGLNHGAFNDATRRLREAGYAVVNPAEVCPDEGAAWLDCMRADIMHLLQCDGIAILTGWQQSRGANIEVTLGVGLGMPVYTVEHWLRLNGGGAA